ncbi:MAG: TonB-dependent receptor [Sphingobacteriales bacterium]|nr:MAG: TonB-dependent receptor [Sphingobacteriales bacterium]
MKRAILLFLLFLSLHASVFAQQQSSLSGKLVEQGTQVPVPNAAVSVFKALADQPFATVITDEMGNFKFRGLSAGTYRLRAGYMGFTTLTLADIVLGSDQEKSLGTLKLLSEQNTIGEVTITATKPIVEFGADGVTYNVDQSVLAEGSTATDILKNVPLVQVDVDGNASIAGKRNTRIFIDGKPSDYMTANITDLLNVLPSDAIEKIEVMTNPPAKYSADGEGIINVVLKKGYKIGFNGNVGVTAGIRGNANTNANASYRGKNWSVNGSGAYRENIGRNTNRSYRQNFFPDTSFYYNQLSQGRNLGSGVNFRTGFDWDITPKQNLRVSANINTNNSDNSSGTDFFYLDENQVQSRVRNQQNTTDGNSRNFNFNADYRLNIDTAGGKLTLGLTVNNSRNNYFTFEISEFNCNYRTVSAHRSHD